MHFVVTGGDIVQASSYHTFDSSLNIAPLFYLPLEPFIVLLVDLVLLLKEYADVDVTWSHLDGILGFPGLFSSRLALTRPGFRPDHLLVASQHPDDNVLRIFCLNYVTYAI